MSEQFFPERLYSVGFTDLISVIPPGAQLTPTSKIPPAHVGKVPGHKIGNGLWAGYDWRKSVATLADVRKWSLDGASTGLRADRFPGIDIDVADEGLANMIEEAAFNVLGDAPVRFGRRPRRILAYKTEEPFGRMRLMFEQRGEKYLVEILGLGQQYLVHGVHPATGRPYEWQDDIVACGRDGLTNITREQADAFIVHLMGLLDLMGCSNIKRNGDGRPITRAAGDQENLLAPSPAMLVDACSVIPNTTELFPSREDYLNMGYAIRAAAGDDDDLGYELFSAWCAKWEGVNEPEVVLADWRRLYPPYKLGWQYLAEQARPFGFSDAHIDFDTVGTEAANEDDDRNPHLSDQWLADKVVDTRANEIRFVPQRGQWIVWTGGVWHPDAELMAEDVIYRELRRIANKEMRKGSTDKEKKEAQQNAVQICSAGKAASVRTILQTRREIAVSTESLDKNPWYINTPAGIVDLREGKILDSDPDALCTKSTSVAPDFGGECPTWLRFLNDATGHDSAFVQYIQRLLGYSLTGSTKEQHLTFFYGPGGNGKGVLLTAVQGIFGSYWTNADMSSFTASRSEKHTTDIAMLAGARLVTASETTAGKQWDEQKVKGLTGGDPITARFMRQDNFVFKPQFKLLFIGNNKPELRTVDKAWRRRIHMAPFLHEPPVVDNELGDKLQAEWPAILAWMIEGCLDWQKNGLPKPPVVAQHTEEYFDAEDTIGRWLNECTEPGEFASTNDLFDSWREWCGQNGEWVIPQKRLTAALVARKIPRGREGAGRRGFEGLKVKDRQDFGIPT